MPDGLDDYLDPVPRPKARKYDEPAALSLISQYESGNRNVPNYRFDPKHTAQGYYQITNTNWKNFAPQAGVDLNQHPTAMVAPRDVQAKVAGLMYRNRGFSDWAPFNPRLSRAIGQGEQPQQARGELDNYLDPIPQTRIAQPTPRPRRIRQAAPPVQTSRFAGAQVGGETQPQPSESAAKMRQAVRAAAPPGFGLLPESAQELIGSGIGQAAGQLATTAGGIGQNRLAISPVTTVVEKVANRLGVSPARGLKQTGRTLTEGVQQADIEANRPKVNVPVLGEVSPTEAVRNVVAGSVGSSPAMILTALGVPAPIAFGLQSNLEAEGRDESFKRTVLETAKGATIGKLFELAPFAKAGLAKQIAGRVGTVGAGTYAVERLTGSTPQRSANAALVNALFAATGAGRRGRGEVEAPPEAQTQTVVPDIESYLSAKEARVKPTFLRDEAGQPVARVLNPEEVAAGAKPKVRAIHQSDTQLRDEQGKFTQPVSTTPPAEAEAPPPPSTALPESPEPAIKQPLEAAQPASAETTAIPPLVKTPKLALGVEAKAVEQKLTKGFEDLPEYQTVNVADQAARATELLKSDPERAKRIAMGNEMPDGDLLPESVFTAVENHALKSGDIDTIRDLATSSSRPAEASAMGQRIRMLAERNPASPVKAIADIQTAREVRAQRTFGKNGADKIKSEIQVEVRRAAPKARDWASFLEEIRCK